MASRTIDWDGKSGREYKYEIFRIGTDLKALPGNYVFAKETKPDYFVPIYVGETEDLSDRFENHHKIQCIKRAGATHLHAHVNDDGEARLEEEADIIAKWDPKCNG